MGWDDPVVGGVALRRAAIRSPNYQAGSVGWTINQDGSAEFNNLTIRGVFAGTNFIINSSGAFFYNGTPGSGNLIGSITTSSGTDGFGNNYLGGFTSYNTAFSKFIQMQSGALLLGTIASGTPDTADAASLINDIGGLTLFSGKTASSPDGVQVGLFAGAGGQKTGSATAPQITINDILGTSAVDITVPGTLIRTNNGGGRDTWQTPSAATGFSLGTPALVYRRDTLDNVIYNGQLTYTGANVTNAGLQSNVLSAAVVSPYVPAWETRDSVEHYTSTGVQKNIGTTCRVRTDGTLALQWGDGVAGSAHDVTALATGDILNFNVTAPLGNID